MNTKSVDISNIAMCLLAEFTHVTDAKKIGVIKLIPNSIGLNIRQKWILIFVLSITYFFFFISSSGINCSNDSGHFALAHSMYNDQQLSLEKYWETYIFKPDFSIKDGKLYSDRLPGNAFLMMPFLAYADIIRLIYPYLLTNNIESEIPVVILLPNLCGVLGLFFLFILCHVFFKFKFWLSIVVIVMAGTMTLYHLESLHLFSHAPSMMLITLAVTIALFSKNSVHWLRNLYIISAIIGFSTIVELQNILFFIPLFFYLCYSNNFSYFLNLKITIKIITVSAFILCLFISILLYYNYSAFGEIILKSNKYNPFFKEEISFFTSLSGNLFDGLDHLFTSFGNMSSYFNWSNGVRNKTPGLFVSNPIFIFSIFGFVPFFKKNREECILFSSLIILSVLIASLHVTTLIRHIFTIHLILFLPIAFSLEWIMKRSDKWKKFGYVLIGGNALLSFLRQAYISNHYYGRDFHLGQFPYLSNIQLFLILNIPIFAIVLYYVIIGLLQKPKNAQKT